MSIRSVFQNTVTYGTSYTSMSWIKHIYNKANKTLNLKFVKCPLHQCELSVKVTAYNTSVIPVLEYCLGSVPAIVN